MTSLIICLCGIPGSGKSTLARHFLNGYRDIGFEAVLISFDEGQIGVDEWDDTTFKFSRNKSLHLLESHLQTATVAPRIYLVDDIMYLRSMRREVYVLGRRYCTPMAVIMSSTDISTALSRNAQRETHNQVNPEAIMRIHSAMEPPNRTHIFDRIAFTIDTTLHDEGDAFATLTRHIIAELEPLVAKKSQALVLAASVEAEGASGHGGGTSAANSEMQSIELKLRKTSSKCIKMLPDGTDKTVMAAALSAAKRTTMCLLRVASRYLGGSGETEIDLETRALDAFAEEVMVQLDGLDGFGEKHREEIYALIIGDSGMMPSAAR